MFMALDINSRAGLHDFTLCNKAQLKNKTMMKKMVRLSELLGNHSNCTKHKITALAYITDELLHKSERVDFLTSSTG